MNKKERKEIKGLIQKYDLTLESSDTSDNDGLEELLDIVGYLRNKI